MKKRIVLVFFAVLFVMMAASCGIGKADVLAIMRESAFELNLFDEYGGKAGEGSGVILEKGLAVTAWHCVNKYDSTFKAVFDDGTTIDDIEVCAFDVGNDIALLRLDTGTRKGVKLRGTLPEVGDPVTSFGNTRSKGLRYSAGVITRVEKGEYVDGEMLSVSNEIQPGDSGGGFFDSNGSLTGICNYYWPYDTGALRYSFSSLKIRDLMEAYKRGTGKSDWTDVRRQREWIFDDGYRYIGDYMNDAFDGVVDIYYSYNSGSSWTAEFKNGENKGYSEHEWTGEEQKNCWEYGEFSGFSANGKVYGSDEMYSYFRGTKKDGKFNGIAWLKWRDSGSVYYGDTKDDKLTGPVTVQDKDGRLSAKTYLDGNITSDFTGDLPEVAGEISYHRKGDNIFSFDFEQVPGAIFYTLYYKNPGEGEWKSVKDNDGNVRKFSKRLLSGNDLNIDYIMKWVKPDGLSEGIDYFNVAVKPYSCDANYDSDMAKKLTFSEKHKVQIKAISDAFTPGFYYYLRSDYMFESIYDRSLGNLNVFYNSNSIFNAFGKYGCKTGMFSIWNGDGIYGSVSSDYSAFNPDATHPPKIFDGDNMFVGYLTKNMALPGAFDPDLIQEALMASGCS